MLTLPQTRSTHLVLMADGVKAFLSSVGMGHHFSMFQTRGYDDESNIPHLTVPDLQSIGVIDPLEIIVILKAGELIRRRLQKRGKG